MDPDEWLQRALSRGNGNRPAYTAPILGAGRRSPDIAEITCAHATFSTLPPMSSSAYSESDFTQEVVLRYTDVVGKKVGGQVLAFLDEWFAAATNLIEPKPPVRDATRFTHAGAWYDGWETRRHNTAPSDWVILALGVSSARLIGAEVDTAFFNGNHAPAISVEGAVLPSGTTDTSNAKWETVIAETECGPLQRHFFVRTEGLTEKAYTHVRLQMYPDGGIARFRLYGSVVPVFTAGAGEVVDTASVFNGGVAVAVSDQHFGSADNLVLPGRGHDMSDGWETKRLRTPGHVDWVVLKLGGPTTIHNVVIDTAHFRGNFPQYVNVKAIASSDKVPTLDAPWVEVVSNQKTGPDAEHQYEVTVRDQKFTHVLLTIIPDGGVKRVRVNGVL